MINTSFNILGQQMEVKNDSVYNLYINYSGFNRTAEKQAATISLNEQQYNCTIEVHGNSTRFAPKKSYDIEFKDEQGEDTFVNILNFPLGEDFVLLANYYDLAFVRNSLAFHLWEQMGHVTPKSTYCNVYIGNDYKGLYLLTEKITGEFHRQELSLPFTTGDMNFYQSSLLMKYDRDNSGSTYGIKAMDGREIRSKILYPKYIKSQSDADIEQYLRKVCQLITNGNSDYDELISTKSFVDFFLLNELTKNPDAFVSSVYLFKDASGKLNMGPVWDFDLAFANPLNPEDDTPEGWMYETQLLRGKTHTMPAWWHELLCEDEFKALCMERLEVYEQLLSADSLTAFFEQHHAVIEDAFELNREHWAHSDHSAVEARNLDSSLWQNSTKEITDFLGERLQWVKENLSSAPCGQAFGVMHKHASHERFTANVSDSLFHIDFGADLQPGMKKNSEGYRYTSSFKYTVFNSKGKEISSGPVSGKKGTYSCGGWEKGTYYLLVQEYEADTYLAISAPILLYSKWFELVIE